MVIASNQSGLGRGLFDVSALNAIHSKMLKAVAVAGGRIDAIFYCPHSPGEGEKACTCRKPLPGLFEQIGDRYGIELKGVPTAGDSLRDLQAGVAAGCEPHLVLTGKSVIYRNQPLPDSFPPGTHTHADLAAFADFLIAREVQAALAVAI